MKKLIVILFVVLLNSFAFSQETEWKTKNYIGFNVGGTMTSLFLIYNTDQAANILYIDNPYLNSYSAGLSFKNFSERLVGISIDLNYIEKGGYNGFVYDIDTSLTLPAMFKYSSSYIELTPLMNIRVGKKRSHINIYAGPHISWLINDKIEFITAVNEQRYKNTADNKFEFGLNAGAGYSFDFKRSSIELRFLYSHGLTDVFNPETSNPYHWFIQNQVMSTSLAYYYKL